MAKSAQAFRTIREVADWLDVAAHVLRFWESKFNQIKPVKRAGGRRYYRPADMELVGGIKVLLHDRGLTIRGVQKLIADEGVEAVTSLAPPIDELIGDGEAIEMDPSDAWEEDAEAEAVVHKDEAEPEAPEPVSQGSVVSEAENKDDAPPPADPIHEEAEEPAVEEMGAETEAPTQPVTEPATADATAMIEESPSQNAPVAEAPSQASRPQSFSLPESNPAEGTLGALAALTQLPPVQRAALGPQIQALTRLRDRMAVPHAAQ